MRKCWLGLVAIAVAAVTVACGDAISATDSFPPTLGATPMVTPSAAASTPTSVLTNCLSATAAGVDAVTGLGATTTTWASHHQADLDHPGGYLPVMQDGIDRYAVLQCTASGRVAAYVLTYIPGISLAQIQAAVAAELPADARVTSDVTLGGAFGCEVVRYASPSLARVLRADDARGEVDVEVTLTSNPENINQVALTVPPPAPASTPGPGSC